MLFEFMFERRKYFLSSCLKYKYNNEDLEDKKQDK